MVPKQIIWSKSCVLAVNNFLLISLLASVKYGSFIRSLLNKGIVNDNCVSGNGERTQGENRPD